MKTKNLVLGPLFLLLAAFTFAADTYVPDPGHTTVGFSAKHLLIARVNGKFKQFDAAIVINEQDMTKSSINGKIQVASISTENENRDAHLKSDDFFNAEKYPEITFVGKSIAKKGDGYAVTGTLTIRDVSREVTMIAEVNGPIKDSRGNKKIGIHATLTINRMDYGLKWDKTVESGGLVVSNEIQITIDSESVMKKQDVQ